MTQNNFPVTDPKKSTDQIEQEILEFWNKNQIFQKSIDSRHPSNEYVFYDGPPFATGLPHYGHFLASVIKDVIPRYYTMKGHRVERTWGWDCHGLPIENIVEEEFGTKSKKDIEEKIGVHEFNEACRSKVLMFAKEWEKSINRLGRWVDFEKGYKTMDKDFMESVMWLFAELHKKNLIYEGKRISLYCPRCATPLSNFEIAMDNSYQIRHDQTATVEFELENGEIVLAWTTTPWTLPSNVAIGFGRDLDYVLIEKDNKKYWIAEGAAVKYFDENFEKNILDRKKGVDFKGLSYVPLFPYFAKPENNEKRFLAIHDDGDYVSTEAGTGIVHFAPYFGEEDFHLCKKWDIYGVDPLLEDGTFGNEVPDFEGQLVVDAQTNKNVIAYLKESGKLFHTDQYSHSYPHCWRCETPLIYKTQLAYFLDIQKIKPNMLQNNEAVNWEPSHLKEGRFAKGLESAPDWNLSRNRFWGSPIPIWKCSSEECEHQDVIGSVEDLEKISGKKAPDLHKHFVDKLIWDCSKCSGKMTRTPEVLDCWFESGAMPYAQKHYPFENKKNFNNIFPADFITEYIAQTRGWFYTLHVLSSAIMGSNSFKNVICTGTILAEDGTKMSKSKKNYPDPSIIFEKYGSDPMRFYLMGSSVMKGENFNFTEKGVEEVLKSIILPLRSAYRFFSTYANIDNWTPTKMTFIRHGEGEHNVQCIYSGNIENEHHLTKEGVGQVKNTSQNLENFDVLYSSPFVRTRETAEIIKNTTNFKDEIVLDDRLKEVDFGNLEGKKLMPIKERYANKTTENTKDIRERMTKFVEEISKKHKGQHIAVVSHAAPIRNVLAYFSEVGLDFEEFKMLPGSMPAASKTFFSKPQPKTELDQWILSELQILLKDFRKSMDSYEISVACAEIAPFIDKLNNWYLRRSRGRFWAKDMTEEKISGYETLFYVLTTLSKILAPIMPFFAEKLFKDLTNGESVHLEILPFANEAWIDNSLSKKIETMREIVSLSAGIRARKKVKLRQPLSKISISVSEFEAKNLDLEIIKEEANVREVEILTDEELQKFATKIVRVNAKKVGPRLGKKVQELIKAGKLGEFDIIENGQIKIAGEILESSEYEIAFQCEEGIEADSTTNVVVLLETEITESLEIEGLSRELIRAIQDLRKSSGFEVSDRINISYKTTSEKLKSMLAIFSDQIASEVLANKITEEAGEHHLTLGDEDIEISITKQ